MHELDFWWDCWWADYNSSEAFQQPKEIKEDKVRVAVLSLKKRETNFKCNCMLGEVSVVGEPSTTYTASQLSLPAKLWQRSSRPWKAMRSGMMTKSPRKNRQVKERTDSATRAVPSSVTSPRRHSGIWGLHQVFHPHTSNPSPSKRQALGEETTALKKRSRQEGHQKILCLQWDAWTLYE